MDLHYLELFNTVATYESYKKASDILHISQPALSVQIKKLEEQIGLKLFDKIGNKIHLSEHGVMLFEYTKRIFSIVSEIEESVSNTHNFIGGTLHIGGSNTPGTYILPELIGAFRKLYPGIKFNLHIGNTSEIAHLINNGMLDIAVNGGNCQYGNNIYVEQLYQDRLVLAASAENEYANHSIITVKELCQMGFIVHKTDSQLYSFYKDFVTSLSIPENINMYLGNIDAIKNAVISNLGISLIPFVAVKMELDYGVLKLLNLENSTTYYPYSLIYNRNKALSATSKKFIEFMRTYISNI